MSLTLTVAIPTRNRPTDLGRALTSVGWQVPRPDVVVVVDDSDPSRRHETDEVVRASPLAVELLRKDEPGLTASRNLVIERCTTDLLTFLDDDVVLRPGYLEAVTASMAADRELAAIGGVVDDDHVYGWTALRAALGLPGRQTGKVYRSGWSTSLPRRSAPVEHLIGCNMTFRTAALRSGGYRFNTAFAGYGLGEDLELTHRLHLDGRRLAVAGDAHLWHLTDLPRHDRAWGRREVVIRPIVSRHRFSRSRFAVTTSTLLLVNLAKNRPRARGNVDGLLEVFGWRSGGSSGSSQKPTVGA